MTTDTSTAAQALSISVQAPKAVKAGVKPEGWSMSFVDPFTGNTLKELVDTYTEDVILDAVVSELRTKFQTAVRGMAEAGRSDEEITQAMLTWKPGERTRTAATPQASILKNWGSLTPEQQAEILDKLSSIKNSAGKSSKN